MRHLTPLKLWDQVRSVPNGRTLFFDTGPQFIGIATHYLDFQMGCFSLTTLDRIAYNDSEKLCRDINLIAHNHNGCGLGFGFPAGEQHQEKPGFPAGEQHQEKPGFPAGEQHQEKPNNGIFVKYLINRLQTYGCRLPFTLVNKDLTTCKSGDKNTNEKNPRLINMYAAEQIGEVFLARVTEDHFLRKISTDLTFDYE